MRAATADRRIVVTVANWTGIYAVDAEVAETISRDLLSGGHADRVTIDDENTQGLRRYPCEQLWALRPRRTIHFPGRR